MQGQPLLQARKHDTAASLDVRRCKASHRYREAKSRLLQSRTRNAIRKRSLLLKNVRTQPAESCGRVGRLICLSHAYDRLLTQLAAPILSRSSKHLDPITPFVCRFVHSSLSHIPPRPPASYNSRQPPSFLSQSRPSPNISGGTHHAMAARKRAVVAGRPPRPKPMSQVDTQVCADLCCKVGDGPRHTTRRRVLHAER